MLRILEGALADLSIYCSPICPAPDPADAKLPKNCGNQQNRVETTRHVGDKLVCQLGSQPLPVFNVSLLFKHLLRIFLHDEASRGLDKRFPNGPSHQEDKKADNNSEEENETRLGGGRPQDWKGGRA